MGAVSFFQLFCEFDMFPAKYLGRGDILHLWTGVKLPLTPNERSTFPKRAKPHFSTVNHPWILLK